jgi:hypothetical protein
VNCSYFACMPGLAARAMAAALVLWVSSASATQEAGAAPSGAQLLNPSISAAGESRTVLDVVTQGRYSISVRSDTGVALRFTSKLVGPSSWRGESGETDGRIDVDLDPGQYLIESRGPERAVGDATLAVHAYAEVSAERLSLSPRTTVTATLRDHETRSYWFTLTKSKVVIIEAAGRALSDLRLWRSGQWLESVKAHPYEESPSVGKPLKFFRFAARLPAATYRVSAYGGPALDWSEDSADAPLYVRRGLRVLPSIYRASHTTSAFGVDRFLVPRGASRYRLELPVPDRAQITVSSFVPENTFDGRGVNAVIDKSVRKPEVQVDHGGGSGSGFELVTIRHGAGKPYTLQYYTPQRRVRLREAGQFFVQTVSPFDPRDGAGPNAMLFAGPRNKHPHSLADAHVINLDRFSNWRGRFNLESTLELFLRVDEAGKYAFVGAGVEATYGLTPYSPPKQGHWKARRPDGNAQLLLTPGYYRFSLEPDVSGIHSFAVRGSQADATARPLFAAARFELVTVGANEEATVQLPKYTAGEPGILVRKLPIDLRDDLPLTLDAGDALNLSVRTADAGRLALAPAHKALSVRRPGGTWREDLSLEKGVHAIQVRNDSALPRLVRLRFARPEPPTESVNTAPLNAPPPLQLGREVPVLLSRGEPLDFVVSIGESGLYEVRSHGLLSVRGALDAPAKPSLLVSNASGVARNFSMRGFLVAGRYRLRVTPNGASEGEARISVQSIPVHTVSSLKAGGVTRSRVASDRALEMALPVTAPGMYRVAAMGESHRYPIRLTDADGWPLVRNGIPGEVHLKLRSGGHRLTILSHGDEARVVAQMNRIEPAVETKGHGPHRLELNLPVTHRWTIDGETSDVASADRWLFSLTANAHVDIGLNAGMEAKLYAVGQSDVAVATIKSGKVTELELPAGAYRLSVRHGDGANRVDYKLSVVTDALLPGHTRFVEVPASIPVVVPASGLLTLRSSGDSDVRATLLDGQGSVVASADDAKGDWNFALTVRAPPGRYMLNVIATHAGRVTTRVTSVIGPDTAPHEDAVSRPLLAGDAQSIDLPRAKEMTVKVPSNSTPGIITVVSQKAGLKLNTPRLLAAHLVDRAVLAWVSTPGEITLTQADGSPLSLRLTRQDLPGAAPLAARSGHQIIEVVGAMASPVKLPAGDKELQLDLPAQVVALADGMTLSAGRAERFTLRTNATKVWLLNVAIDPAQVGISVLAAVKGAEDFAVFDMPTNGTLKVRLPPSAEHSERHVLGAVDKWQSNPRGLDGASALTVEHSSGRIVTWFENTKTNLWRTLPRVAAGHATGSITGRGQWIGLPQGPAGLVRIRADGDCVIRLGGERLLLRAGEIRHVFRPYEAGWLGVVPLDGPVRLTWQRINLAPLAEGVGRRVWLGPGEAYAWRIQLNRRSAISIGFRLDAGQHTTLQASLVKPSGEVIGRGLVQSHTDNAGDYTLWIENAPDASPRAIAPVLVGTREPPSGPPISVLRRYGVLPAHQGTQP